MYVCGVVWSAEFDILLPTTLRLTVSIKRYFWSPNSNVLIIIGKSLIEVFQHFDVCRFFSKLTFLKKNILLGISSESETVLIKIGPNTLYGLIWVHSGCKGYQQTSYVSRYKVNRYRLRSCL